MKGVLYEFQISPKKRDKEKVKTESILKSAIEIEIEFFKRCCGVYFLINNGIVVYVGQSVNIYHRINSHFRDKVFNSVRFIEVPRQELNEVEAAFIRYFEPHYNWGANVHFTKDETKKMRLYCPKIKEDDVSRIINKYLNHEHLRTS